MIDYENEREKAMEKWFDIYYLAADDTRSREKRETKV